MPWSNKKKHMKQKEVWIMRTEEKLVTEEILDLGDFFFLEHKEQLVM